MSKKKKETKAKVSEEEPELEEIEEIAELEEAPVEEKAPKAEEKAVEEAEPEEEIIDERIYTVPLRMAYWSGSRLSRANRSVRILKEFVERHMKPEELLIQPEVNDRIWARGIQKPPRRLRIRATKNADNLVRVYLAEG
ncbi:MAG: 50S ribosomal protein L31e [Candidatus Thorarchaeota archaeon]